MPHNYTMYLLRSLLRNSVISDLIFGDGICAKRVALSAYDTSTDVMLMPYLQVYRNQLLELR